MLYVIPTPVGNLEDITVRAKRILSEAKILLCEDPRSTAMLLKLLDIKNDQKLIQLSKKQEINFKGIDQAIVELKQHNNNENDFLVGLVCDAGTPGISDPGKVVIQKLWENNLEFTILPGATSLIPAVVASGMLTKDWCFKGFLPIKKGRQTTWKEIAKSQIASVIFESVHRMEKSILEMKEYLPPNRLVFIAREISKLHEAYWRGKIEDLDPKQVTLKGEFVLVIGGVEDIL
jgi:16S rRNA (cytidine1402-2'-O)-methyltransferase